MKIQLRPSLLQVRRLSVKWIILHHTVEMYKQPFAKIDNKKLQIPELLKGVLEDKTGDINYHYIIEQIKDEFYVNVARPFVYKCVWPDISNDINDRAIHVALLGNYNFKIPEVRLYEILAYRLLNPFMKMFKLSPDRIKLHRDVSDNKDLTCPGEFIERSRIEAFVRRFVIK